MIFVFRLGKLFFFPRRPVVRRPVNPTAAFSLAAIPTLVGNHVEEGFSI